VPKSALAFQSMWVHVCAAVAAEFGSSELAIVQKTKLDLPKVFESFPCLISAEPVFHVSFSREARRAQLAMNPSLPGYVHLILVASSSSVLGQNSRIGLRSRLVVGPSDMSADKHAEEVISTEMESEL
jgi:hypothetical protein